MKFVKVLSVLALVAVLSFLFVTSASAYQEAPPENVAIDFLTQLLFGLTVTVPGFTALGVVLINLLKIPGWIKDGAVPVALNVFNVVSAIAIGVLTAFFPQVNIPALDVKFGEISNYLIVLLPTFVLLYKWLAPLFYGAVRGVPLLGYSNTLAKAAKVAKK